MTATRDDIPTTYVTEDQWAWRTPHSWRYEFADNPSPALDRSPLLDRQSERHPLLDALFDLAVSRILLTADGATMQLKVRISGGKATSSAPVSSLAGDIDQLGRDYTSCRTHRARLQVIKRAQDVGMSLRFAPDRSKVRGTEEWREAIGTDPRPQRVLVSVYGVSFRDVVKFKREFRNAA